MDFETAAKALRLPLRHPERGAVIRVHRALSQFMLDTHVIEEHGLQETWTPVLVKEDAMYRHQQPAQIRRGQLPNDQRLVVDPDSSEVTLTNTVAGDILDEAVAADPDDRPHPVLPVRGGVGGQGHHRHASSASVREGGDGDDLRPRDRALAEHERMTRNAPRRSWKSWGLPYRTVVLCTGDMGFGSARRPMTLEVWLPGQNTVPGDLVPCSTCGQFQARRMNARYRPGGGKPEFVATLNGSGLAVGRCLIAVLENGQRAERVGGPARRSAPLSGGEDADFSGGLVGLNLRRPTLSTRGQESDESKINDLTRRVNVSSRNCFCRRLCALYPKVRQRLTAGERTELITALTPILAGAATSGGAFCRVDAILLASPGAL